MSSFYLGKFVAGEKSWQLLATKRMLIYSVKRHEAFAVTTLADARTYLKEDESNRLIIWDNGEWKKVDLIIEDRPTKAGFGAA
jgi:hypothetical protein